MQNPLVTIGVPFLNGESTIDRTLRSIAAQDYKNIEVICSDNCSTDRSLQICKSYLPIIPNLRIEKTSERVGMSKNINNCFRYASGKLGMFLSADDWLDSNAISELVRLATKYPGLALYIGQFRYQDCEGKVTERPPVWSAFRKDIRFSPKKAFMNFILGPRGEACSTIFDMELFNQIGGIRNDLERTNTWVLYTDLASKAGYAITAKCISNYWIHPMGGEVFSRTCSERLKYIHQAQGLFRTMGYSERSFLEFFRSEINKHRRIFNETTDEKAKLIISEFFDNINPKWRACPDWPGTKFDTLGFEAKIAIEHLLKRPLRALIAKVAIWLRREPQ